MKNKLVLVAAILPLIATVCFAQTAAEVEAKYGKATNAYSVNEYVWMTPEFAADGQVCRMRLYPKRVSGNTNYVVKELPFDDFKEVVDQLISADERGPKSKPFDAGWTTGGGSMWATFTYDRVRITYATGFRVDPEAWKDRKEFVFSVEALSLPDNPEPAKPQDDFLLHHSTKVEIVTITWLGRKCSKD